MPPPPILLLNRRFCEPSYFATPFGVDSENNMQQQLSPRKSGVTIQTCSNFVEALKHNRRVYTPSYAYSELSHENESIDIADIAQYVDDVKSAYIERTGKSMPSNTVYLREAVFVLDAHHTMDDMRKTTDEIALKLGLKALHISIHRDEGKSLEERNWHAHVIFGTIGADGKTVKLGKKELIKLQDIAASTLRMQRTEPFKGGKHLGHKEYRKAMAKAEQSEREAEKAWQQKPPRKPTEEELLGVLKTFKEDDTAQNKLYKTYTDIVKAFNLEKKEEPRQRVVFGFTDKEKRYIESLKRQILILQNGIKTMGKYGTEEASRIFTEAGATIIRVRELETKAKELQNIIVTVNENNSLAAHKLREANQAIKTLEGKLENARNEAIENADVIKELRVEISGIAEDLANERPIQMDRYKTLKAEYKTAKERAAEAYKKRLGREDIGGGLGR